MCEKCRQRVEKTRQERRKEYLDIAKKRAHWNEGLDITFNYIKVAEVSVKENGGEPRQTQEKLSPTIH